MSEAESMSAPRLEWKEHQRRSLSGVLEDVFYEANAGELQMFVEMDVRVGKGKWKWAAMDGWMEGWEDTPLAAQLAAEDWLRAQRDALSVLGDAP